MAANSAARSRSRSDTEPVQGRCVSTLRRAAARHRETVDPLWPGRPGEAARRRRRAANPRLLLPDLVDRAQRGGHDEQRAIGALAHVRRDAEAVAEQQRLALGQVVLARCCRRRDRSVAGRPSRSACGCVDRGAGRCCCRGRSRSRRTGRPGSRLPSSSLREEVDPARGELILPRHLRIAEARAGEPEQPLRRLGGVSRCSPAASGPAAGRSSCRPPDPPSGRGCSRSRGTARHGSAGP